MSNQRTAWAGVALGIGCLAGLAAGDDRPAAVVPLRHAHAHNDYEHERPLFDALDCGFCSVEADVFLRDGRLLVGHTPFSLKPDRTLERLYLDPLRERAKANGGRIYRGGPPVFLLVDVKTEANPTYTALDRVLARYADLLSVVRNGKFEQRAVTVVVSGNRASEQIAAQPVRYAGIDGRLTDLDSTVPAHLMPWISDRWTKEFRWQGEGPMPAAERAKLQEMVQKAHRHGRLVRFWATPEKVAVWKELRAAGVDLINTDKLSELQRFLLGSLGSASRP
jgi:glycerophosphoryl diester phosphodiesterase family protein